MLDFPVRETTLDNGLKVLTVEHHQAPITTVWVWYRVGSRNERPGITGISHWTEHMCFKGGTQFGKGDIFKEVAKVGGYNNGMTSTDFTVYFETVPSEHAELALRIEADRMTSALFEPDEVASERSVIISEREGAENSPQFLLGEELSLAAYRTHPYRWSVVGWKADLKQMTHADLWDYYKAHYAPDNAVLIVAGDFDTDSMLGKISAHFAGLEGHSHTDEIRSIEPRQEGERRIYVRRPGTTSLLQMAYHIPPAGHEDQAPLRVLNSVLSGTPPVAWLAPGGGGHRTARLYKGLIETELAASAACGIIPAQVDPGLGTFYATARVGVEPERLEQAMLEIIRQAVSEPPSDDELSRAKTQINASMAYAGESAAGIAGLLGQAEMSHSYTGIRDLSERVAGVTAQDVLRVAQTYLTESNLTTGWFIPTDGPGGGAEAEPADPQCFRRFFYTGLETLRDAQRQTLGNGLKVVACRSDLTPSVAVHGLLPGGALLDSDEGAGRARLGGNLLTRGTQSKTHQEIFAALDAVGATLSTGAGLESTGLRGNALTQNLELLLETAADCLRNPTFPDDELSKTRTEMLTYLRQEEDSTREVAVKRARLLLYPAGHPYHVLGSGTEETLRALDRSSLLAWHDGVIRPDRAVIVIVGDIDPEAAIGLVERHFGDWDSPAAAPAWQDLSASPPEQRRTDTAVMGNKTQCDIVIATTGIPRASEDYYALQFATDVLGRLGFMGRFGATVRDELGLAYYCFSNHPDAYGNPMWMAQAGVNPANVKLATDTMVEQIRRMQDELITPEEYSDLMMNQLGTLAMRLETKAKIAMSLIQIEQWRLGSDYYERYPDIAAGVSREDIQKAAQRYFRPEEHVFVVAGPQVPGA